MKPSSPNCPAPTWGDCGEATNADLRATGPPKALTEVTAVAAALDTGLATRTAEMEAELGDGVVVIGAALACIPREATRPPDTAITAPALAAGRALPDRRDRDSCGRGSWARRSEVGAVCSLAGARWRPPVRDDKITSLSDAFEVSCRVRVGVHPVSSASGTLRLRRLETSPQGRPRPVAADAQIWVPRLCQTVSNNSLNAVAEFGVRTRATRRCRAATMSLQAVAGRCHTATSCPQGQIFQRR